MNKRYVAGIVLAFVSVFQAHAIRVTKIVNSPRAIEEAQKTFKQALANNDTKTARDVVIRLKKIGQTELALQLNSKLKDQKWSTEVVADLDTPQDTTSDTQRRSHPSKRKQTEKKVKQVASRQPVTVQKRVEVATKPAQQAYVAYTPQPEEVDRSIGSSKLMAERLMQAIQAEQQVRDELYATSRKLVMVEQDNANLKNKEQNWHSNQAIIQELSSAKESLDRQHAEAQQAVALLESQVNSLKQVEELAESVTRENEDLYAQTQELEENNQELTGQLHVTLCELEVAQTELKNADIVLNKTPRELAKECIANELSAREAEQRCLAQAEEHNASIQLLETDLQRTEQLLSSTEQEKQNTMATLESIKMAYTASENKCSEQSQEVGRCLNVIAQLEQDIKKSEATQEQLEGILAQGKQKYLQLAESARNTMEQLKGDLKESCEQVNQQTKELQAERAKHEAVSAQLAQTQDIMQGYATQIATLSDELQAKTEEVVALTTTEKKLRNYAKKTTQALTATTDERDQLHTECHNAKEQIASLTLKEHELCKSIEEKTQLLATTTNERDQLHTECHNAKERVATLASKEQELCKGIEEKTQLLAIATSERDEAYAEYNSVNQQVATLNQELLEWSMRYDELANNHTEKVHRLTQQVASAENIIKEQQDNFSMQTEELKSKRKEAIRRATKSARAKITMLQENNNSLKVAVNKLQEERKSTNKQCSDMQTAMKNITCELDGTSKQLAALESDHKTLCQSYAGLEQQLALANSNLAGTVTEREKLKTECVTLEQRVCSLQQDLAQQESRWQKASTEKTETLASVTKLTEDLAALRTASHNKLQAQAKQFKNKSKQAIQVIMQTANEKLETFKQKNAELEAMLIDVESEKKEKQSLLQRQLDAMKHMLTEKESSLKITHEKQAKATHQKRALEKQYSKLNSDVQELNKELLTAQETLSIACNEKSELRATCDNLNLQVSSLKQQLHEQVEGAKQKGQEKIQTIVQAANTKLDALKEENNQLKEALAHVEHEQHKKRLLLEKQLDSLKNKFAELSSGNRVTTKTT